MKKKIFLLLFFIILCIPFRVDAVKLAYPATPRGGNCDSNGNNCEEWYDLIYTVDSNKYRAYCLDDPFKGPGKSGTNYTYLSQYNISGKGPACAFIATGVPRDYWDYSKFGTSGNTSTMIKNDYKIKSYVQDNYNSTTKCSKYYYVSGSCNKKNQAAAADGSTITVSLGKFSQIGDYSVAKVTVAKTKSIAKWKVSVSGVSGAIITKSNSETDLTNLKGKTVTYTTMYVKVPRENVTEKETVKVAVSSTYETTCTYEYPYLRLYYASTYVTNDALNATGKKYFNATTGRRLATAPSSTYQSVALFKYKEKTVSDSFSASDSDTRSLNPSLGDILITKTDSINTSKKLDGVIFGLYSDSKCTSIYENYNKLTTGSGDNDAGSITVNNLPVGTYYVKEISTIAGYKINTSCKSAVVNAAETVKVSFTNDPLGSVEIHKMSYGDNANLANAEFKLYKEEGCKTEIATKTTDANGLAKFDNLEKGTYYLKESTAPNGYAINSGYNCKEISIDTGDTTSLTIKNKKNLTLTINKTDAITNERINGVEFKLYNYTNDRCGSEVTKDNYGNTLSVVTGPVSDDSGNTVNGVAEVKNLPYGSYCYKEIKVPDGYILDEQVHGPIVINKDVTLNIKNSAIRLEIEKVSLLDKKTNLPGSQIRLAYLSNATNENLDQIVYSTVVTEDKDVSISVIPGIYAIYEDYAPVGYVNLQESFLIEVKDDGSIIKYSEDKYNDLLEYPVVENSDFFELKGNKLTIINDPTYIKISKQDITSFKEVEGATIIIYDENGQEKDKFVSNGKISNKFYLEPGKYTLVEQVPPKGYKKIETKINFTLGDYGYIALEDEENKMYTTDGEGTIILYNEIEIFEVPITGLTKNMILITLGIALVSGGVYLIYRRKKAY